MMITNIPVRALRHVNWTLDEHVLTVELNRPEKLNALNMAIKDELIELWAAVAQTPQVRAVVLTGRGRAFCVGGDSHDLAGAVRPDMVQGIRALDFCPGRTLDVPVILAVNGMCIGGALNFLADADVVIAAASAYFTDPHVTMGQVSGPEMVQLAAKTSFSAVATLGLSGRPYRLSADQAQRAGLVAEVVAESEVLSRAQAVGTMIAAQSPTAVRKTLEILRRRARTSVFVELDEAWDAVISQWPHHDSLEGPQAFLERREPCWAVPDC